MTVWFVTGGSRGLGAAMISEALARGHFVAATARDVSALKPQENLLALQADVTDEAAMRAAVDEAVARFGRIDVLVNNAGRGLLGAVEEVSDRAARDVFDVNVFGVLNTLRAALPTLRAQRSGHVLNISSMGGFATSPGWGLYGATKFALEAISEALHAELTPLGIKVTVVEPGGFRTDFLDESSLHTEAHTIADYAASAGNTRAVAPGFNHVQPGDPAKLAAALADLVAGDAAPLRLQLGSDAVARVESKLDFVRAELSRWREVSVGTDL